MKNDGEFEISCFKNFQFSRSGNKNDWTSDSVRVGSRAGVNLYRASGLTTKAGSTRYAHEESSFLSAWLISPENKSFSAHGVPRTNTSPDVSLNFRRAKNLL